MSENFNEEAITRFIKLADKNSVRETFGELGELGFRFHKNTLCRTWLTGTEVYAMVYHVVSRVNQAVTWSKFTSDTGLQKGNYLTRARIPAETQEMFIRSKRNNKKIREIRFTPYDLVEALFKGNWWLPQESCPSDIDILNHVISVWETERGKFLNHTQKTAVRFPFAKLFPIDPLVAPMADYCLFGEHLNTRYKTAEEEDEDIKGQCLMIARKRTIELFRNLSATTLAHYSLPDEDSLESTTRKFFVTDVEKSILKDPEYRKTIREYREKDVGNYSYYSYYQLDVQAPGLEQKIGLVDYFSQKASKWLQSNQSEVESDMGKEATPEADTSIDIQYFQSISGWKNAVIDRKVNPEDSNTYGIERADSYSRRYISQEMQTLEGEPFCLFNDFLLEDSARSLLISSDSCSGKTTIVRGISALAAQAHLDEGERDRDFIESMIPDGINKAKCLEVLGGYIPVIISQPPLSEVSRYGETYKEITGIADNNAFLEALYTLLPSGKSGFTSLEEFKRIIGLKSSILFIVDSIDEVPAPRMNYIDQLKKLVQEYGFGKVLITSRHLTNNENTKLEEINNSLSQNSPIVKILPLDEQRQKALLKKVAGESFKLEDLRCFPGASGILSSPLVLVAMARYRSDCVDNHKLVDEALRSVKTMLASLGSLPMADAVNEKIQETAFQSLKTTNEPVRFETFSREMKQVIKKSNTFAQNNDSYAESLLQGILWRSGLFTIHRGGAYDYIDFRYEALKGWWASEYIYRRFDEDLSSRDKELPSSRFAGTISCFRSLMEGPTRMSEASRLAVLCGMEKIASRKRGDLSIVEDEDELRLWVIKTISERIFLYSAYPESSDPDREFAKSLYKDASSFGFTEGIKGFCLES